MAQNHKIATSALAAMNEMRINYFHNQNRPRGTEQAELEDQTLHRFLGTLTEDGRPDADGRKWLFTMELLAWIVKTTKPPRDEDAPGTPQGPPPENTVNDQMYGQVSKALIIFCGTDRYQEVPSDQPVYERAGDDDQRSPTYDIWLDPRVGVFVDTGGPEMFKNNRYYAETWPWGYRPRINGVQTGRPIHPAVINLQPYILDKLENQGGFFGSVLDEISNFLVPDSLLAPATGTSATRDLESNLDYLLFHEITHTFKGLYGDRVTDDNIVHHDRLTWTRSVRKSGDRGHLRADNVALFAFTAYLIREMPHVKFNDEGDCEYIRQPQV